MVEAECFISAASAQDGLTLNEDGAVEVWGMMHG